MSWSTMEIERELKATIVGVGESNNETSNENTRRIIDASNENTQRIIDALDNLARILNNQEG